MGTAVMERSRRYTQPKRVKKSLQVKKTSGRMNRSLQALAEAIILQSIEDLTDSSEKEESMEFFAGEGFRLCTELAGIGADEKIRILGIAGSINQQANRRKR